MLKALLVVLVASVPTATGEPAPDGVIGCYLLRLGPPASSEPVPIAAPRVLDLRAGGRLRAAIALDDSFIVQDSMLGSWQQSRDGMVTAWWTAGWLGGTVELHLRADGDGLRGRFAPHGHQVDDGRLLWRGNAYAVHVSCGPAGVSSDHARDALQALRRWGQTQHSDSAAAIAEAFRDFEAFLRTTPIHSLSILNYRIAEFACHRGRLPRDVAEVTAAVSIPPLLAALEERTYRDAWGRPVRYMARPPGYEVRSAGPDGHFGTTDDLVSTLAQPLSRDPAHDCT